MRFKAPPALCLVGALALLPFSACALAGVTISAPAAGSNSVSGSSDSPTLVGTHSWVVTSDESSGASLTLQADSFAHTAQTTKKASVRLNLIKTSGAAWNVGTGVSTSTPSTPAQVTASSSAAGDASFSIDVTFVPGDVSVLPSGSYATTIVGTISAN
jgi:hypothetical protein